MAQDKSKTAIGSVSVPPAAWLASQLPEPILDPGLTIVDPHHHLWDRPGHRYLLDELLADTGSGHKVLATVFVDCMAFYRAAGPAELKCVGETEFANGARARLPGQFWTCGISARMRNCANAACSLPWTIQCAEPSPYRVGPSGCRNRRFRCDARRRWARTRKKCWRNGSPPAKRKQKMQRKEARAGRRHSQE